MTNEIIRPKIMSSLGNVLRSPTLLGVAAAVGLTAVTAVGIGAVAPTINQYVVHSPIVERDKVLASVDSLRNSNTCAAELKANGEYLTFLAGTADRADNRQQTSADAMAYAGASRLAEQNNIPCEGNDPDENIYDVAGVFDVATLRAEGMCSRNLLAKIDSRPRASTARQVSVDRDNATYTLQATLAAENGILCR